MLRHRRTSSSVRGVKSSRRNHPQRKRLRSHSASVCFRTSSSEGRAALSVAVFTATESTPECVSRQVGVDPSSGEESPQVSGPRAQRWQSGEQWRHFGRLGNERRTVGALFDSTPKHVVQRLGFHPALTKPVLHLPYRYPHLAPPVLLTPLRVANLDLRAKWHNTG